MFGATASAPWREWRHNPCIMRPLTSVVLLTVALLGVTAAILKFPTLVLGWILSPVLSRLYWVVEFWYPTGIGKWLHVSLVRWIRRTQHNTSTCNDVSRGFHSRSTETRVEVVPGRVFVHVMPQWLDNLGYLVVCLPPPTTDFAAYSSSTKRQAPDPLSCETTPLGNKLTIDPHANVEEDSSTRIVAFCVDCGDANEVAQHVRLIRRTFYQNQIIHVQSVLSTHKHHDHTAGNLDILKHPDFGNSETTRVKLIFGGAVDKVPGCNYPLANGDKLPLPRAGYNNMNDVVEVEAVATPAHTRGSLTYVLRPLAGLGYDPAACLFTGDTIFSAGGGVPFEADTDAKQEQNASKMTANSYIRASAAAYAMERCLAEVLFRSVAMPAVNVDSFKSSNILSTTSDAVLVFPGHEYTNELLARQLATPSSSANESCKWKNMSPDVFFQTVSNYYVSLHRRTLPHSSGKLLTIPSTVTRERYINPHLRSLKQRGTIVIAALKLWHRNFCRDKVLRALEGPAFRTHGVASKGSSTAVTTPKNSVSEGEWNLSTADLNRPVFATVYAADLESIIQDLSSGKIHSDTVVTRLKALASALEVPVIGRRPIPGTLPSSRSVYRGLLALALLGSAPTALTHSDSATMKLPAPISSSSSNEIRVSKTRLISVLHWLGLLDSDDGLMIAAIIGQLWKETKEYNSKQCDEETRLVVKIKNEEACTSGSKLKRRKANFLKKEDYKNDSTDVESVPEFDDEVALGALKWVVYGIPEQRPKSWLSAFCMPCSSGTDDLPSMNHPAGKSGMNRHGGELVRHDVLTCPLCRSATGRTGVYCQVEDVYEFPHEITSSQCNFAEGEDSDGEDSRAFVEVSTQAIVALEQL